MGGSFESRSVLIGLVDEVSRLSGRLKSAFADSRRAVGLGDSEMTVLNCVVEADRPPTVSQIGRSLGQPRQVIQRAANALAEAGLIEMVPNPDHKRAALLQPRAQGLRLKREADAIADGIALKLQIGLDRDAAREAVRALHIIRKQLETCLRGEDLDGAD